MLDMLRRHQAVEVKPAGNGTAPLPTLRKGDCGHWLSSSVKAAGKDEEGNDLFLCERCYAPVGASVSVPSVQQKGYLPKELQHGEAPFNLNDFPLGDIDNFSVSRHCYAMARARYHGENWAKAMRKYAPWESSYLEALERHEKDLVDRGLLKAQGEYVSSLDGGALAPEYWSLQWSDLLRAFSAVGKLPVVQLRLPYRILHMPKVMGDVTIVYPGENNPLTASQFQLGQLSYTARKAGVTIAVSNETMRDAPMLADALLRQSSARAIAYDRDLQLLTGQGGPNPTGLITMATAGVVSKYYPGATSTTAISTTPANGIPSFLHLSQLRQKVHRLNGTNASPAPIGPITGQAHCNGMIVHSRFEQDVLTQGTAAGPWTDNNGRPLWMGGLARPETAIGPDEAADTSLMGQIWSLTNILPTNSTDGGGTASSFIIAGWWQQYAWYEALQVAYDTTMEASYFASDQTGVRVLARGDGMPIHPEAFAVLAGANSAIP